MTIPQVLPLVTRGPFRADGGIVGLSRCSMRALKRFDGLPWEKMVIALAVSAIAAWSLGWIAGTIVSFFVMR